MDITPLPIRDSDQSDNDESVDEGILVHWVVRLTPYDKFTDEQLIKWLDDEFKFTRVIVGKETVPQVHYHLVIQTDISYDEDQIRLAIRCFMDPLWCDENGKLPRGYGNKQYNMQSCQDVDKAVSYAVKLGKYWNLGFDDTYVEERKAASFTKNKKKDFQSEYQLLCTKFQTTDMDLREFMISYVQLKASYGQQVVITHAYAYGLSNLIKRDPERATNLVDNFLYKV